jgi:hypothetical protein
LEIFVCHAVAPLAMRLFDVVYVSLEILLEDRQIRLLGHLSIL